MDAGRAPGKHILYTKNFFHFEGVVPKSPPNSAPPPPKKKRYSSDGTGGEELFRFGPCKKACVTPCEYNLSPYVLPANPQHLFNQCLYRYGLQWVYVLSVPSNDFLGAAMDSQVKSVAGSVAAIVAILLLAMVFAWHVTVHLRHIRSDMALATALRLDCIKTTDSKRESRVTELRAITAEFRRLVVALKSFRKYIPGDIVGFLLESKLEV